MTKRVLTFPVLTVLAATLAACGSSSTAPGVQQAPSGGLTAEAAAPATPTTSTPTTSTPTTTTPSTPLPAALSKKPTVAIPTGPPPKKLVIKDIIKGTGPPATASSTVTVQYVGVVYKGGTQFDASWNDGSGQPVSFPLSGVIPGWTEGIPGMRVGGRRELIIPPSLAYKNQKQAKIPANSTLVFVIDLHSIS
jgi:peptidylprolyl isomerase